MASKRTLSGNQLGVLLWVFNGARAGRDYSEKTGSENIRTIGSLVRLGLICSDHDPITYHSLNRWVVTFDGLYTLSDAGLITESERDAVMKPQPKPKPAPTDEDDSDAESDTYEDKPTPYPYHGYTLYRFEIIRRSDKDWWRNDVYQYSKYLYPNYPYPVNPEYQKAIDDAKYAGRLSGLYTLSDAGLITESERDAVMKPQPKPQPKPKPAPAPAPEPEPEPIDVSDIPFAAVVSLANITQFCIYSESSCGAPNDRALMIYRRAVADGIIKYGEKLLVHGDLDVLLNSYEWGDLVTAADEKLPPGYSKNWESGRNGSLR